MQAQPNILWITTDQQRADHLGLAGLTAIATPHLDRLGREGIHHQRAYCPCPTCTPARVSWLTGTWPSRHGSYSIGTSFDGWGIPTLPTQFAAAGYRTGLFGKTHFVARPHEAEHIIGPAGAYDTDAWRRFTGPYCGFQEVRCSSGHTNEGRPNMHYRAWLEDRGADSAEWFPAERGERIPNHEKTGVWNIPADRTDSAWATDEALAFMQRNGDGPWMCQVHYQDPHTPFTCPEPWFSRVAIEAMQLLPDAQPGEFDDKPAFYRTLWERRHGDWWQEGYPGWNDEHEGRRIPVPCAFPDRDMAERAATAMQATLGMVAHIDHQVGRLLTALEDSGLSGDTIVVFTSDHGELHGHHGLWGKGLPAYEDCQRVPLLVWAPQRFPARGGVAQLANTADLPLSLCRLAGIDPAPGMQGCDLSRFWRGEEDRTQPATVIENRATRASVYQTTLVTDRHKLVMYRDQDDWECYDLQADPDQHRNLWGDPTQQALHADLLRCHAQTRMRLESVVAPRTVFA